MIGSGAKLVQTQEILAKAQRESSTRNLSQKLLQQIEGDGVPYAKTRLGWIQSVNYDLWTCTALIGDQVVPVPDIPMASNARPVSLTVGIFTQVGDQYILLGVLMRDTNTAAAQVAGGTFAVRKTLAETRQNSSTPSADNELFFYGVAGRSYVVQTMLIFSLNSTFAGVDMLVGMTGPTGTGMRWSGGANGPDISVATASGSPNFTGVVGSLGTFLPYGYDVSAANKNTMVPFLASVTMGTTGGRVSLAWAQNSSSGNILSLLPGSWLRADVTNEITI